MLELHTQLLFGAALLNVLLGLLTILDHPQLFLGERHAHASVNFEGLHLSGEDFVFSRRCLHLLIYFVDVEAIDSLLDPVR